MRLSTWGAATVAALIAVGAGTGPAYAEGSGESVRYRNKLIFQIDGGPASWQSVQDSPLDSNSRAFVARLPRLPGPDVHVFVGTLNSLDLDVPVTKVKNVSFDVDAGRRIADESPLMLLVFDNNDLALLPASTCRAPIAAGTSDWVRADFTGARTGCSFEVRGDTRGTYAADGTRSALAVYAAAHPERVITSSYLTFTQVGNYAVDRIAFGTDLLYNYGPARAYRCNGSESRC